MEVKRVMIPLGDYMPDRGDLANEGTVVCRGFAPVEQGGLLPITVPAVLGTVVVGASSAQKVYGAKYCRSPSVGFVAGTHSQLRSLSLGNVSTGGGAAAPYATPDSVSGWQFSEYGAFPVATNFVQEVQMYDPALGWFVDMIQSGGGGAGFRPKSRLVWPMKGNLFVGHCSLPVAFDGLAAGLNPYLVAWSQTENIRNFGSVRQTPQFVGAGFQPLLNDLGSITAAIGGDYSLVYQERGITRIDGPPYYFRTECVGVSTSHPNSIVRVGPDVYFWADGIGPCVMKGGEGTPVRLTTGRIQRSLFAYYTGLSDIAAGGSLPGIEVSAAYDSQNDLLFWSYNRFNAIIPGTYVLVMHVPSGRFSIYKPAADESIGVLFFTSDRTQTEFKIGNGVYFINRILAGGNFTDRWGNLRPYGSWSSNSSHYVLRTGFAQLTPETTSRIRRVRPAAWRVDSGMVYSITVRSRNTPWLPTVTSGPYSVQDSHGWVVCPDTVFADLHSLELTFVASTTSAGSALFELEGFVEAEIEDSGVYGA